jgi:coenzyme F420-reducing hydrogenase beta subunit
MTVANKNVVNTVVKNNLCVGCGMCTYKNEDKLEMIWNDEGFLVPQFKINENLELENDLEVCPFNPIPEKQIETENEIADIFLKDTKNHHPKIGRYNNLYVGYANEFRKTSSSGGIATFVFTALLESGQVDHVISVKESANNHYEYSISSTVEDLLRSSKTKYYPVTLATILSEINKLNGKVAVAGVACFIKSLRLAQYHHPELKEKITFLVGIICGGIKSSFFAEYLASKTGVSKDNFINPQFRIKDDKSNASDYSYSCVDKTTKTEKQIKMKTVGDMWGTGLFKANACDFCDDVTTELADISLGDAWLQPYVNDGKGTSVVVTRSKISDDLIQQAIQKNEVRLENLSLEKFLDSQRGSFNHRQIALPYRINVAKKKGQLVPPKRFITNKKLPVYLKIIQVLRMKTRAKSLAVWKDQPNATSFDEQMFKSLRNLKIMTKVNHKGRAIFNKLINK